MDVLTILPGPWTIEVRGGFVFTSAMAMSISLRESASLCSSSAIMSVRIVEQALRAVGKANRKEVGVGPPAATPCGMGDEILDLEEAVQAEIPIGLRALVVGLYDGRGLRSGRVFVIFDKERFWYGWRRLTYGDSSPGVQPKGMCCGTD